MTETGSPRTDVFRVVVTCATFEPGFRGGGPVRSVGQVLDTAPDNTQIALVTSDRDLGFNKPYPGLSGRWVAHGRSRVFYLNVRRPSHWIQLVRELRRQPIDLLYLNSLWNPRFTILPVLAARLRLIRPKSLLLAPRGELSPGALAIKPHKKKAFLHVWKPLLRSSGGVTWHASTALETGHIRNVFPHARIIEGPEATGLPADALPAVDMHNGVIRLVFISRISRKKNLTDVLEALSNVTLPADLDIFGPIEDAGYWRDCQALITRLPHNIKAVYKGTLRPENVRTTFSAYDAFTFPTMGENFGHVIAESLSASCPVICTDTTPWTETLQQGGGVIVRGPISRSLSREISRLAALESVDRLKLRQAAGDAYAEWRAQPRATDVFTQFREGLRV
jgi:glycosyltransferase involved in cell wall biosynthesis